MKIASNRYAVPAAVPPPPKWRGAGDVVAAVTRATGIAAATHAIAAAMGTDCQCDKRQELLNKAFPFGDS